MVQHIAQMVDMLWCGEVKPAHRAAALVAQAKQGDPQAFDELVYRHQQAVLNLARRIVADSDAAQDILQEVIIKAYRGLAHFREDASFATWLYRITINETRAYLRREKRRAHWQAQAYQREHGAGTPAHDEGPLLLLLQELPEKQRITLSLFYLQELSLAEVAAAMGAPVGSVKAWLSLGRQKLRALALERKLL